MSNAASAYARVAQTTSSPRDIEAQALLKAARQLEDVKNNWTGPDKRMTTALMFNRQLWTIFLSAAESNDNPQPIEVRQKIANIGVFVMNQTIDMQLSPEPEKLSSLIAIKDESFSGSGLSCMSMVWFMTKTPMLAIFCRTSIGCGLSLLSAALRKIVQSWRLNISAVVMRLSGPVQLFLTSSSCLAAFSNACASMSRGEEVVCATRA